MLKYAIVPVTFFQQNCTIFWCSETHQAAIIDPGGDAERIKTAVADNNLTVTQILLTHGHLDHVGAARELAEYYGAAIIGPHQADLFWLEVLPEQSMEFGMDHIDAFMPDKWLNDGDTIQIGHETLEVLHCPGHTPGHVVFFSKSARLAQVGDVLFKGSIGRTDFLEGDYNGLISSIQNKLWPLGDNVTFIPGHGPLSTFGDERMTNPYVGISQSH